MGLKKSFHSREEKKAKLINYIKLYSLILIIPFVG